MRPIDTQAGNMSMLHAVCGLLFHFRENIADYFGGVVWGSWWAGDVDGDV